MLSLSKIRGASTLQQVVHILCMYFKASTFHWIRLHVICLRFILDFASISDRIASNGGVICEQRLERMYEEAVVAYRGFSLERMREITKSHSQGSLCPEIGFDLHILKTKQGRGTLVNARVRDSPMGYVSV